MERKMYASPRLRSGFTREEYSRLRKVKVKTKLTWHDLILVAVEQYAEYLDRLDDMR